MPKKMIVLVLACTLVFPLGLVAKEKRGSELIVQKKDGTHASGELIAVKKNSLLLKDFYSGVDVSVDIKDVKVIMIEKESKALFGAGIGFGIGGVLGALIGSGEAAKEKAEGDIFAGWFSELSIIGYVLIFGLGGAIVGGIAGGLAGTDTTIPIEGKSDSKIQKILEKLRKNARIPDFN